jgi:hypothetical protein
MNVFLQLQSRQALQLTGLSAAARVDERAGADPG